jgi:PAS domain S-box-containing protein
VKAHFAMQNAAAWCRPIQTAIDHTRLGAGLAAASSDLSYACYFSHRLATYLLLQGSPLEMVSSQCQEGIALAHRLKFRDPADIMACQEAFIANMRGETAGFSSFNSALFDEAAFEAGLTGRMPAMVCWYWILKLEARFISRDFAAARAAARNAAALVAATQSFIQWVDYVYFGALSIAALHDDERPGPQADELDEMHAHLDQLGEWADACPTTFLDKHALVGAEVARLEGRELDAMRLYERAIRAARDNGFVHNAAIAYERASAFYRVRGFEEFANIYLRNARHCYLSWGADGKVRQLDELYPNLAEKASAAQAPGTIQALVEHLDLATVIKVSQAVSAEIVLDKLIETLMRTALEHAGAERGLLLLPRGAELKVEAEARSSGDAVIVRVGEASVAAAPRSELIVNYVLRTQENVILDDASAEERFSADEYLREHRARSILCLPLLKQAKLIGILYLENNLAPHAFTPARSALLRVLASEAAISLENSRLYRDLEEREAKIRRLVDANIIGVSFWDVGGRITEANDAFLRTVGYSRQDLQAGHVSWSAMTPPEYRGADENAIEELMRSGTHPPYEKEYVRKDGSRVVVLLGGAFIEGSREQGVSFVLDMTERRRAEYLTRQVFESSPDVVCIIGRDYRFQKVNPAVEHNWKVPAEKIVGMHVAELIGRELFEQFKPHLDRCFAGEHVSNAGWFTFPHGRFYRSVMYSPLRLDPERVDAALVISRDLTEYMLASEALREAQGALARTNRATTLGMLGASIAHEVNQPLGAIAASAAACSRWLSAQPPDLDKAQRSLERIGNDGRRASAVIDRLRALVKRQVPRKDRFDLNVAILEVLALTDDEVRRNDILVETSLDADLPKVEADRIQIQQIILNLVVNAIEAMSALDDRRHQLAIGSAREGAKAVRVEVRDSGPGVDASHAERVFEAFYTTKAEGMGMGLPISRAMIEAHGGRLWVSPNGSHGAAFCFSLPVEAAPA